MATAVPVGSAAPSASSAAAVAAMAGAGGRAGWARRAARGLAGRNLWALADQVLISGANFVAVVLPKRTMGEEEFGSFSLVYSVLLLANIVQSTLLTQPHNVLAAGRAGEGYRRYTSSTAVVQVLLALVQAMALGAAAWVAYSHGSPVTPMLVAMVPAVVGWQLQEFCRRVLYTEERYAAAFWNDLVSYGGQTAAVIALYAADRHTGHAYLTGPAALYALAVTSFAAAAWGAWQIRRSLCRAFDLSAVWENWVFGRWLLGGEMLQWWSSLQMYIWLTAELLGKPAAGDLRATQTLFGPMRVFTFYLGNVLPIRFARTLEAGGHGAVHKQFLTACRQVLPLLGAYCLAVAIVPGPILHLAYKGKFTAPAVVLSLYAIYTFVSYLPVLLASVLTAKRATRPVFLGNVWGALLALPVGYGLIRGMGLAGAPIAMGICSALMAVYFVRAYADSNRPDPGGFPVVAPVPAAEPAPAGAEGDR